MKQAILPSQLRLWRLDELPRGIHRWIEPDALAADADGQCWLREDAPTFRQGVLSLMLCVVRRPDGYHVHLDPESPFYGWPCRVPEDRFSVPVTMIHEGLP